MKKTWKDPFLIRPCIKLDLRDAFGGVLGIKASEDRLMTLLGIASENGAENFATIGDGGAAQRSEMIGSICKPPNHSVSAVGQSFCCAPWTALFSTLI